MDLDGCRKAREELSRLEKQGAFREEEKNRAARRAALLKFEREAEALTQVLWTLPLRQAEVLQLRYLEGLPWEQIPGRMGCGLRHCYKLHAAARKALAD